MAWNIKKIWQNLGCRLRWKPHFWKWPFIWNHTNFEFYYVQNILRIRLYNLVSYYLTLLIFFWNPKSFKIIQDGCLSSLVKSKIHSDSIYQTKSVDFSYVSFSFLQHQSKFDMQIQCKINFCLNFDRKFGSCGAVQTCPTGYEHQEKWDGFITKKFNHNSKQLSNNFFSLKIFHKIYLKLYSIL